MRSLYTRQETVAMQITWRRPALPRWVTAWVPARALTDEDEQLPVIVGEGEPDLH
jgi:hypothetical protein